MAERPSTAVSMRAMEPRAERNLLEAWLHGWTMILLAIAATLTIVGSILAACGASAWFVLLGAPLLPFAATTAFYARLARTP